MSTDESKYLDVAIVGTGLLLLGGAVVAALAGRTGGGDGHLDLDRGVFDALRSHPGKKFTESHPDKKSTDEEVIKAGIDGGRDPWLVRRHVALGIRPIWPVPSVQQMLVEHPEFAHMTPSSAWKRALQMYNILPSHREEFLHGIYGQRG